MALTNKCSKCGGWNRYAFTQFTDVCHRLHGTASTHCVDCHHVESEVVTPFVVKYKNDKSPGPNDGHVQ